MAAVVLTADAGVAPAGVEAGEGVIGSGGAKVVVPCGVAAAARLIGAGEGDAAAPSSMVRALDAAAGEGGVVADAAGGVGGASWRVRAAGCATWAAGAVWLSEFASTALDRAASGRGARADEVEDGLDGAAEAADGKSAATMISADAGAAAWAAGDTAVVRAASAAPADADALTFGVLSAVESVDSALVGAMIGAASTDGAASSPTWGAVPADAGDAGAASLASSGGAIAAACA